MKIKNLVRFASLIGLAILSALTAISQPASTAVKTAHSTAIPAVYDPVKIAAINENILQTIKSNNTPGAVLWIEHRGQIYASVFGKRALLPEPEETTMETIYDVASLTKVMATTPAMLLLIERGKIKLDEPVKTYLPDFKGAGRDAITIRHLMTHSSGLPPGLTRREQINDYASGIAQALVEKPGNEPGTNFRYSDVNFILLGEVARKVAGRSLPEFVRDEVYLPLGMKDTFFLPSEDLHARIAPTEKVNGRYLRGIVHDPTSRHMGGVAGHAGLFSTAADAAKYCRMMLNGGELNGVRIFKPETVKLMTSIQSPAAVAGKRGLGWDIDSPYAGPRGKVFPIGSYGHTGWTGPSMWLDPFSQTFVLIFCNRNHPDGKGNVLPLRVSVATMAAEAIKDFDFKSFQPQKP